MNLSNPIAIALTHHLALIELVITHQITHYFWTNCDKNLMSNEDFDE